MKKTLPPWNRIVIFRRFVSAWAISIKIKKLFESLWYILFHGSPCPHFPCIGANLKLSLAGTPGQGHWSPTVPVSVWLPEPARDRGSKQKTLNDDCYHTTCRSAVIFGVQTVLSYLVLTLNLWIGLCPMKRSSGMWSFDEVSVTYRRSFSNHTLAGALWSGNILPEPAFRFTTVPLFHRAQLNSVSICITAF